MPTRSPAHETPSPVIEVTLTWSHADDLDLHLLDPNGFEIWEGNPPSPEGGQVDPEVTPGQGDDQTHVERIVLLGGEAPTGEYRAWVVNQTSCGGTGSFFLEIDVTRQSPQTIEGETAAGSGSSPVAFELEAETGG